jgi:hypothetical protein
MKVYDKSGNLIIETEQLHVVRDSEEGVKYNLYITEDSVECTSVEDKEETGSGLHCWWDLSS